MNIQSKINKLITALKMKGHLYLVNKEQFYSESTNKICSIYKLFHLMPAEEYNMKYPDDKKDPNKYSFVKLQMLKTFSPADILLELVEIYKQVGGSSG